MRIPYCFLDEDHLPCPEPCFFEDDAGGGRYVVVRAQTRQSVNGYTFLRTGEDVAEAEHNLWEALWSVFAPLPGRPSIPCPPEAEWLPSDDPRRFVEFDETEGRVA